MTEKQCPVAVCTRCHEFTYNVNHINERCYVKIGKRRCEGVFRSAIGKNDWTKCSVCNGSGVYDKLKCTACRGSGVIQKIK